MCFETFAVTVVPAHVMRTGFGAVLATTSPLISPIGVETASVSVRQASSRTSTACRRAFVFEQVVLVVYTSVDWKIELLGVAAANAGRIELTNAIKPTAISTLLNILAPFN